MALKPYEEFAAPPLEFPVGGKTYVVPAADVPTGIMLTRILSGEDNEWIESHTTAELYELLLGTMWNELIADGVSLQAASRCGMTALVDFQYGRELAEAAWEAGADPKALSDYLMQSLPRAQRRSRNTGGANTTQKQASTKGTTSPRQPADHKPKASH